MVKVVLNLAVSLDGYIAREDGSVDWLDNLDTDGSDLGYGKFLDDIGTIITGRVSFEDTKKLSNEVWPFKNIDTFVMTTQNMDPYEKVIFTDKDIKELVMILKKSKDKNIWLFGGGILIKYFREENLIDEYIITTIPVLIGSGKKLFQPTQENNSLELLNVTQSKGIIQTHYKVKK